MEDHLADKKFRITRKSDVIRRLLDRIVQCGEIDADDGICIVSVIGKSPIGYDGCKSAPLDNAIGRNVFRGQFGQHMVVEEPLGTLIEGYFDSRNKVLFLHVLSTFDTDVLIHVTKNLSRDLNDTGFLQVWSDIESDITRTLLIIFIVSHIIVTVHPSIHFDTNYLHLFRVLDMIRVRSQTFIADILKNVPQLSSAWIDSGRPCSPRMLFFFESFDCEDVKTNLRQYELHLEDQIYRFLRKSRIITNICSNSLFAVCNQMDFVFVSTKDATIRKPMDYLSSLVLQYLNGSVEDTTETEDEDHTFYNFLWSHINVALTKGFNDNVGRHSVIPVFEIPTLREAFCVLEKLTELLFENRTSKQGRSMTNQLENLLDTDVRFSNSRCSKGLPLAMGVYQDGLPSHYTREFHERKVAQALQAFTVHARGPAVFEYAKGLRDDCDRYWRNGRQMCEVTSLTGHTCTNPVHEAVADEEEFMPEDDSMAESPMPHCSNFVLISACDCGRKQMHRKDPFTVRAANYEFYSLARLKCNCGQYEEIAFPVFQPSTKDARAAISSDRNYGRFDSYEYETGSDKEFESQPDIRESYADDLSQSSVQGDHVEGPKLKEEAECVAEPPEVEQSEPEETDDEECDDEYYDEYYGQPIEPYMSVGKQSSTTEYLPGMLHTLSPAGLLPNFSSWSLVCQGPSSIYSHNLGLHDQHGFIGGANTLLPWDVTVKIEHTGSFPPLWEGKRPPGIKNKKTLKDGTQFTVKLFVGIEYECARGHRFTCSAPHTIMRPSQGSVKENGSKITQNDMPLYTPCICSRPAKPLLAQLMRIHIVTPKAPVHVTLNPRVQPAPTPCPIFYPGNLEPIKLSQSTYWILRFPFVYQGDHGVYVAPKDHSHLDCCRLIGGSFGVTNIAPRTKST
ncbi:Protein SMG8 [Halotydeus destructor]|nr:Protein SMG8 [Halotydeus destructor]